MADAALVQVREAEGGLADVEASRALAERAGAPEEGPERAAGQVVEQQGAEPLAAEPAARPNDEGRAAQGGGGEELRFARRPLRRARAPAAAEARPVGGAPRQLEDHSLAGARAEQHARATVRQQRPLEPKLRQDQRRRLVGDASAAFRFGLASSRAASVALTAALLAALPTGRGAPPLPAGDDGAEGEGDTVSVRRPERQLVLEQLLHGGPE